MKRQAKGWWATREGPEIPHNPAAVTIGQYSDFLSFNDLTLDPTPPDPTYPDSDYQTYNYELDKTGSTP
jgi:hypothetical protein